MAPAVLIVILALVGARHASQRHSLPSLGESDFTLTAWVRTTAGGVVFSLSSEEGVWAGGGKAFVIRDGKIACDFANVGIWAGVTHVADGRWHELAWAYSVSQRILRFYVDGRLDGTVQAKGIPDVQGDIYRIGMAAPGITPPNGFVGEIDDVRLYAACLAPEDVRNGTVPTPAAYWPLDGDGRDASGNGHDGIVVDASAAEGVVGRCLQFDGSAALEMRDPNARLLAQVQLVNPKGLVDAIADLVARHGDRYRLGAQRLQQARRFAEEYPAILAGLRSGSAEARSRAEAMLRLQRDALLDSPELDFDRILVIRRSVANLGLPPNWCSNSDLPLTGFDNELMILSDWRTKPKLTPLFRPDGGRFVGDVDLHFDGDRLLFSMPGSNGRWQVHELRLTPDRGSQLRELPLITEPDVDNYDACYLPDEAIIFTSTAPFVGVPCVTGSSHVANLYRAEPDGRIRRLTFEQDHDWCPTVMPDGRVMYLRWEYSDLPHFVSRILFTMNPDGTNQMAFYGSNSYWPNSMFYARPIPGSRTKFAAIVSGHHDTHRMGELILFDTAKGTQEAGGVIQRIPGRGKPVEPVILDALVIDKWPKFLHPWPLDDHRFLVAAQLTPIGRWGLYLADTFDNLVLIHEVPGSALLEPIPLRPTPRPPAIPSRVTPDAKDATVLLTDIYIGPGLAGVPRGTVKTLRVFTYHFAYHGVGGQVHRVGLDGPWDIKRILGTVPVYPDGSAHFRIPANTPVSIQPLDSRGRAVQLMRSWMTAMPGERLSCGGCHEPANSAAPNRNTIASRRPPDTIRPWYGPPRGFSFRREVQPVLDKHCIRCHGAGAALDLRDGPDVHPSGRDPTYNNGSHFPPSYLSLRRYVRGHTIESDMHLLTPAEFHASTTRLARILEKGHYGVQLDSEAWDRIYTWIDLNTPAHGTWGEIVGADYVARQRRRRMEMDTRYAGVTVDPELPLSGRPYAPRTASNTAKAAASKRLPETGSAAALRPTTEVRPSRALTRPRPASNQVTRPSSLVRIALAPSISLQLIRVPPGTFVMGDAHGDADERPPVVARIAKPFLIGRFEITNAQYHLFDPRHDSGLEVGDFLQFSVEERGYPVNLPAQPVCRVSWHQAAAFCRWLSAKTGRRFRLPTEAEWEYACRAGTQTPMWYGDVASDFGRCANLADSRLRRVDTFAPWGLPSGAIHPYRPAVDTVDDGHRVSAPVGSYVPNPWGLYDMHGNVAEWTSTPYGPLANAFQGRQPVRPDTLMVVRGGSWYDLPKEARASYRKAYPAWQRVFDVGFRVVCED